ncbi:MAG: hypothetical protein FJZ61_04410 [Chlamydiae bacterium]|nr:hypothetical protein [Chlamydiota bacterium]
MISGGILPSENLFLKPWKKEVTCTALKALLSPDKEYPCLRLCQTSIGYWLEPVHYKFLAQEKNKESLEKTLASIELIDVVAKKLGDELSREFKKRLDDFLEPQLQLKSRLKDLSKVPCAKPEPLYALTLTPRISPRQKIVGPLRSSESAFSPYLRKI